MDNPFEVAETHMPATPVLREDALVGLELIEADELVAEKAANQAAEVSVPIVRMVSVGSESGAPEGDAARKEKGMPGPHETPPGGFPKSIHGYNVGAVDDYVRKINSRLESLLSQVQSESSRADHGKRVLEAVTAELETMRRRAADAENREIAALEAQKRSEEEAHRLVQELKEAREKVRGELDIVLADAREERDILLEEERQDAEAVVAEARRMAAEAQSLLEPLQQDAARMAAEIAALRAVTSGPDSHGSDNAELLRSAEEQQARLEAEIEAQRAYARTEIDEVVNEARRNAAEAGARAAAVYREHEEHVRALGSECEALVLRIKEAVEAQLTQLPSFASRLAAGGRSRLNDEPEEKRVRDNSEWRTGDWRNAS